MGTSYQASALMVSPEYRKKKTDAESSNLYIECEVDIGMGGNSDYEDGTRIPQYWAFI
jgi:hypothetical protein